MLVKVSKEGQHYNEELVLAKDEKQTPEAVLHRGTRSVFIKIQGVLRRVIVKEGSLEAESLNLHTFPSDKFAKFYISPEGTRLASIDVNGAVRVFDIEKTQLRPLAGFGISESLSKSRKSSVGKEKASQADTRNPFEGNLQSFESSIRESPQLLCSPAVKSKRHVSLDHSTTALFESIKSCAFIADHTLLMVDESDHIKMYDFKKRLLGDPKVSLLEDLAQSYSQTDGVVFQNDGKMYYLSYASPKSEDENSTVAKTQLISVFEISSPE